MNHPFCDSIYDDGCCYYFMNNKIQRINRVRTALHSIIIPTLNYVQAPTRKDNNNTTKKCIYERTILSSYHAHHAMHSVEYTSSLRPCSVP
mmetsp:Transcript_48817/g.52716  ORF Transcript_48817/g.52716 Transcript_48817/m.52716 type:complete len:91 (-) Transcript_48817:279-551(-)